MSGVDYRVTDRPNTSIKYAEQEEIRRLTEAYLASGKVIKQYGATHADVEKLKNVAKMTFNNSSNVTKEKPKPKKRAAKKAKSRREIMMDRREKIARMRAEGKSDEEIIQVVGVAVDVYRRDCKEHGIETSAAERIRKTRQMKIKKIQELWKQGVDRSKIREQVVCSWELVCDVVLNNLTE